MPTTAEVLGSFAGMFGRIPSVDSGYSCELCLGPVNGYRRCSSCHTLFAQGLPDSLLRAVVPMTSVLNPSRWYTWLQTYKTYHRERGDVIASLTYEYLEAHGGRIEAHLGGSISLLTIVPSKRPEFNFNSQPLRRALSSVAETDARLFEALRYIQGARIGRSEYRPDAFKRTGVDVSGARVVIIEDLWVTGATALSAAGALHEFGAESVLAGC